MRKNGSSLQYIHPVRFSGFLGSQVILLVTPTPGGLNADFFPDKYHILKRHSGDSVWSKIWTGPGIMIRRSSLFDCYNLMCSGFMQVIVPYMQVKRGIPPQCMRGSDRPRLLFSQPLLVALFRQLKAITHAGVKL